MQGGGINNSVIMNLYDWREVGTGVVRGLAVLYLG